MLKPTFVQRGAAWVECWLMTSQGCLDIGPSCAESGRPRTKFTLAFRRKVSARSLPGKSCPRLSPGKFCPGHSLENFAHGFPQENFYPRSSTGKYLPRLPQGTSSFAWYFWGKGRVLWRGVWAVSELAKGTDFRGKKGVRRVIKGSWKGRSLV